MTSTADDMRPNERSVALNPASDATLRFVGVIHTPSTDRNACLRKGSIDGPDSRIVIDPVWHDALEGLEEYQSLEILYWLDQSRRDLTRQSPHSDGRTFGTFAQRLPVRPNPISTSIVKLLRIEDITLHAVELDCIDGTLLINIKPDRQGVLPKAPPTADNATGS